LLTFNLLWLAAKDLDRVRYFFWFFNAQTVIYLGACVLVVRYDLGRPALLIVLLFAAVLRLSLIPTAPALSTDIYRYIWDGTVQAHGINPFIYHPAAPELSHLRDPYVYENINRREYALTAYPPAAQLVFLLSALLRPRGLTTLKLIFLVFDFATVGALLLLLQRLEMNPARVAVYAWSPLAVWEIAQNGHVDAVAVAFIALAGLAAAHGRRGTTGVMLALAALVKIYPAVLAAAFYKKWDWRMPTAMAATAAILYTPYLGAGSSILGFLTHYPHEEGFFSGERFLLLQRLHQLVPMPPVVYLAVAALTMISVAAYLALRDKDLKQQLRGCTLLAGLFLSLVSPQYGWYYLWLLPFLSVTLERVTATQMAGAAVVLLSFARYHFSKRLTPDLLVAPLSVIISLVREAAVQWWWLMLLASAAFLSWV